MIITFQVKGEYEIPPEGIEFYFQCAIRMSILHCSLILVYSSEEVRKNICKEGLSIYMAILTFNNEEEMKGGANRCVPNHLSIVLVSDQV